MSITLGFSLTKLVSVDLPYDLHDVCINERRIRSFVWV